jgi:hypothetical protein
MAQFPTYNFSLNQGSTFRKVFTKQQPDGATPVDLTGYSARMHLRQDVKAPGVELELTTSNGGITINPVLGRVEIYITALQSADLAARDFVYDIELYYDDDGEEIVERLVEGKVTVRPEVTRPQGVS